jgi:hypothetical protein
MGGAKNRVHVVTASGVEDWSEMTKEEVATKLVERIVETLARPSPKPRQVGSAIPGRPRRRPLPKRKRKR